MFEVTGKCFMQRANRAFHAGSVDKSGDRLSRSEIGGVESLLED